MEESVEARGEHPQGLNPQGARGHHEIRGIVLTVWVMRTMVKRICPLEA